MISLFCWRRALAATSRSAVMVAFALAVILRVPAGLRGQTAADPGIAAYLARLVAAYPDHLDRIEANALVWKDGTRMAIDDGKGRKAHETLLATADIKDMFYTPYHLPHIQLPHSVARAVLFKDATLAPIGRPVCDTLAVAKRDLKAGEVLDGMGGFTCYGLVDSYDACRRDDLLPMALSVGCRLKRDIPKDQPIGYRDVELPKDRLCDKLRAEQLVVVFKHSNFYFSGHRFC